jgi:hypothetical protein
LGIVGVDEDFSAKGRSDAAQVELHAVYDFIINRFLAAVDIDYRYAPASQSTASFRTNQDGFINNTPFVTKLNHRHDFGLSVNLGGLVTENFALYAIGNVRLGKFSFRFEDNKPGVLQLSNGKRSQNLWGAGGGLGGRYAFKNGFPLRCMPPMTFMKK